MAQERGHAGSARESARSSLPWSCRSPGPAHPLPSSSWTWRVFQAVQVRSGLLKLSGNHLLLFILLKKGFVKHGELTELLSAAQVGRSMNSA